jgi:hypothetical protein
MNDAEVKLTTLKTQMQWFSGKPQNAASEKSRMLYDFNHNILSMEPGYFSQVSGEKPEDRQESSICFEDTGEIALFFDGKFIYDGAQNKVNKDNPLATVSNSLLTSVIAPSMVDFNGHLAYNIYYINDVNHALDYATAVYANGRNMPATYAGYKSLDANASPSPLGLACVNQNEYWVLSLENVNTLAAYLMSKQSPLRKMHIHLNPFSSLNASTTPVNCSASSIVTYGDLIAITVNGNLMYAKMNFTPVSGFSLEGQKAISVNDPFITSLSMAFNYKKTKLFYLKTPRNGKGHVFAYDIAGDASYDVNPNHLYSATYKTLKLAPDGVVYGINDFTKVDPLLTLTEKDEDTVVGEVIIETANSSLSFGNSLYELNEFK